jgi:hypothetical protein
VKDAVSPKCIITGDLKDILLNQDAHKCSIEEDTHKCSVEEDVPLKITTYSPDLPPGSIIVPDLYKTYLNS